VFRFVAAGTALSCGIRVVDSAIDCWGEPYQNAAGAELPPAGEFNTISMGGSIACGLTRAGAIKCWGNLGTGATAIPATINGPFPLVP
jgi:hypothetical protein